LSISAPADAGIGYYARTRDGVIVYPDTVYSGNTRAVKLEVIRDNIIRVTCSAAADIQPVNSLITTYSTDPRLPWNLHQNDSQVVVTTDLIQAAVTIATGAVRFTDRQGREILAEKKGGGRDFEEVAFNGEPSFHIRQTFSLQPGEVVYGLGQHQDGQLDYKGRQITLFQNNSEVAIPFLVSDRNYGLLWDNYSLTRVGDLRTYEQLSALKLFSRDGQAGWLTSSYSNDCHTPSFIAFERAESTIDYPYLNDTRQKLPPEFKAAGGMITWEGAVSSDLIGEHSFRVMYAGYIKVWIGGKLLLDRWRQNWNPCTTILNLMMEKGKKYPIRIEWIPDGDESYLSMKWLGPLPASGKDDFSFSSEAGHQLDYFFIYGENTDEVIAGYRTLTGKSTIPPRWAFGLWQSRERYKTQQEILQTVGEFRKRQIPLDNIVLDWNYWKQAEWGSQEFDAERFPSPDSMIRSLHDSYHARFMISVWPKFYEGISTYQLFNDSNWLYRRNIADRQRDWIGKGYVSTFYDAFNQEARTAFWNLLEKKLYTKGVDAWWMDASEPDILSNVSPEKRKEKMTPNALGPAAEYLNAYPLENARGIYEGQRAADSGHRVFILTRSAFAGSQRYGAAVWSGDIAARWSDMKTQITAGLNFSLSGLPYWTMDIGGFAVEHRYEYPDSLNLEEWREQMTRWYQFGAFCPLFRVHGQYPFREIYNVAPESHPAYQSMLYYDRLRYRLLPYIYSLAGMTFLKDYTLMRALVMDFPQDAIVKTIGDQYLFGPSLLVDPVCTYKSRNREVYLPAGQGWYDLYSGRFMAGGQWIRADAPFDRIPVQVKEGSIIPFGPALQYTDEKPADPITLYVYTGKDAGFTLYEDEGTNYHYEKGSYSTIRILYSQSGSTLTIGPREGDFPGMLKERVFRVFRVSPGTPVALDINNAARSGTLVRYNGKQRTIHL
jgi:alpha-D-xyloside xylohydrolase